jgi:hypothetical protein
MDLRRNLTKELRELSQQSYLLALATTSLLDQDSSDIARSLPEAVNKLCSDGQVVPDESVEMTPKEVKRLKASFTSFTTDLLLVELQALLHTHLMLAAGYTLDQPAVQIEALLAGLWPKEGRGESEWAYKEVILLTEIRNAVMHARGQVDRRSQRLLSAGWSRQDLDDDTRLERRSFSDFLRFKRAVRTIANAILAKFNHKGS